MKNVIFYRARGTWSYPGSRPIPEDVEQSRIYVGLCSLGYTAWLRVKDTPIQSEGHGDNLPITNFPRITTLDSYFDGDMAPIFKLINELRVGR